MYDLLTDELIGVRTTDGEHQVSLPTLYALLAQGAVERYTDLRAHQANPWHVFLVQVAASIQARHPTERLPTDPVYWHDGLLDLADGLASAWSLVVEDVTKPAFLQHPWKSWEAEAKDYGAKQENGKWVYQPKASTPDELDVLVTSKNHDVKMSRVDAQEVKAWLYALLLYQTTSGYLGSGNYGIVRMNGGFASRPIVAWVQDLHPARRFADEVSILCSLRVSTVSSYGYQPRGTALTWLKPWNRKDHQYSLHEIEPWFIEATRPVRLYRMTDGAVIALGATSKKRQIGPSNLKNGDVGDPWIPINIKKDEKNDRSALTLSDSGFTPGLITNLLFEQNYELTALQKPRPGVEPGWFVASALVRGQGTTEGFHHIELPVPPKARLALLSGEKRETLADFAQLLLNDAKFVMVALTTALTVFAEGGPETADFDRDAVKRWLDLVRTDFSNRWKYSYFPTLWRGVDEDRKAVRLDWQRALVQQARELLEDAHTRLPHPSNRNYRAITEAHRAFAGVLRKKGLPEPTSTPAQHIETNEELTA